VYCKSIKGIEFKMGLKEEIRYHIFADCRDIWCKDYQEALMAYKNFCGDYGNARLYSEVWEDDEFIEENYLEGQGDFPM
jgi:hypothetical protein